MAAETAPPASASHYSSVDFAKVGPNAETQSIPHHISVETAQLPPNHRREGTACRLQAGRPRLFEHPKEQTPGVSIPPA